MHCNKGIHTCTKKGNKTNGGLHAPFFKEFVSKVHFSFGGERLKKWPSFGWYKRVWSNLIILGRDMQGRHLRTIEGVGVSEIVEKVILIYS